MYGHTDRWESLIDPSTGREYFHNVTKGETSWSLPPGAVVQPKAPTYPAPPSHGGYNNNHPYPINSGSNNSGGGGGGGYINDSPFPANGESSSGGGYNRSPFPGDRSRLPHPTGSGGGAGAGRGYVNPSHSNHVMYNNTTNNNYYNNNTAPHHGGYTQHNPATHRGFNNSSSHAYPAYGGGGGPSNSVHPMKMGVPMGHRPVEKPVNPFMRQPASTWAHIAKSKPVGIQRAPVNSAGGGGGDSWPVSLKTYVAKCFSTCDGDNAKMERMKRVIHETVQRHVMNGTLHGHAWEEEPIPECRPSSGYVFDPSRVMRREEEMVKERAKAAAARINSSGPYDASYIPLNTGKGGGKGRKRKLVTSPTKKNSKKSKKQKQKKVMGDDAALRKRQNRFKSSSESVSFSTDTSVTRAMVGQDFNDPSLSILGTCTKIEKKYLRLTSAPDPSTVRPLPILLKALELVQQKWDTERNYVYACEQLKSIRQDMLVQHIQNESTATVYELHATIALQAGDLNEFNQCQTQLRLLHAVGLGLKRQKEFIACRILYFVVVDSKVEMNEAMSELSGDLRSDEYIKHALNVRKAVHLNNYHRYFQLYDTAPVMSKQVMDKMLDSMRNRAVRWLMKAAGKTDFSVAFLAGVVQLTVQETIDLLKDQNIALKDTDTSIDCKTSLATYKPNTSTSLL